MYLLFIDESGTHGGSPCFVLGGLAVHEQDAWYLQRLLHSTLRRKLPKGHDPADFELHANEIKSPHGRKRKASNWIAVPKADRFGVLRATYTALAGYGCQDVAYPCSLFGAVVDRAYTDREERAYEEVLHRFDEMLTRQAGTSGVHQRGLVIHDRRVIEKDVQTWTDRWRHAAGRIGKLTHLADVPLFADSRASRLIQAADFVAYALWRYYGINPSDASYIEPLWSRFDQDNSVMHGLVHVSKQFKSGKCGCEPCMSRRGSTDGILSRLSGGRGIA